MHNDRPHSLPCIDVAVVGGGIAGAWLLRVLSEAGYRVALFEGTGWGADQTLASQGMIHGGLKYALGGKLTGESEAIAGMPARWRGCLAGEQAPDLRGLTPLSDNYYMFGTGSALGRLTGFFAARTLRGRIDKLDRDKWPGAFEGFDGVVYALNDFVLDTPKLLAALTEGLAPRTFGVALSGEQITPDPDGFLIDTTEVRLHCRYLVSCAGNGSAALQEALHISNLPIQNRPLKQVIVRPRHRTALYAHCITGVTSAEPRLTITTHQTGDDFLWYLGGRIATEGVDKDDAELCRHAAVELSTCVPWLDWEGADYSVLAVNRAEPAQGSGRKPDEAYAAAEGRFIQAFPTKLTLAPDLGDKVLALLPGPQATGADITASTHPVSLAQAPWAR